MKWKNKNWQVMVLAVTLILGACKNPLDGFDLIVTGDVIKDFQTLEVLDTKGNTVKGVNVRLIGGDTDDVYNMDGVKSFTIAGSLLEFGVDPNRTVTADNTVEFQVELSGTDYVSKIVAVEITPESSGIQKVTLVKNSDIPASAGVVEKVAPVTGGTITTEFQISTAEGSGSTSGQDVSVSLPAGIQLRDAAGVPVTGGELKANVMSVDPSDPDALALFPGGSYTASKVVTPSGAEGAGFFNTGAFTTIDMSVGSTVVTQFSAPIAVEMNLSPDFKLSGNQPVIEGTQLAVYSISAYDPTWKFQKNVTVGANNKILFETDHLTSFMVGEFVAGCTQPAVINFSANWIAAGTSFPFTVDVVWGGKVISSNLLSINDNVRSLTLKNLSEGSTIVVRNNITGESVVTAALAACGSVTNVTIPAQLVEEKVTLQLYVRCPGKENVITVLPTFQLYYRESNSSNPQYKFLGTVTNGFLQTNLLKSDGTLYAFQAVWGSRVKIVGPHAVSTSNVGTVGTNPGDIIGQHAGATNLGILTEECNKL